MAVHLVCYAGIARPGHSYAMSSSYWVNTGTEPETLTFRVDPPSGALWIKMKENSVTLNPGQAVDIPVTLILPLNAVKDIYGARLIASSGAVNNVEFAIGMKPPADCTAELKAPPVKALPVTPKKKALPVTPKGSSGPAIPAVIMAGLLTAAVLTGLRIRRNNTPPGSKIRSKRTWGRDMPRGGRNG